MSEGKHTPLPWKYYTSLGAECVYVGAPPRDNPQGIIAHMDKQGDAVNAAFIVNAVNSHDQLVEALTGLMCWTMRDGTPCSCPAGKDEWEPKGKMPTLHATSCEEARAALGGKS